jgi:hypothetical protein
MVQQSPDDSTSGAAKGQGFQLGGGVIASLAGVGLLLIFMIQNTEQSMPLYTRSQALALRDRVFAKLEEHGCARPPTSQRHPGRSSSAAAHGG